MARRSLPLKNGKPSKTVHNSRSATSEGEGIIANNLRLVKVRELHHFSCALSESECQRFSKMINLLFLRPNPKTLGERRPLPRHASLYPHVAPLIFRARFSPRRTCPLYGLLLTPESKIFIPFCVTDCQILNVN